MLNERILIILCPPITTKAAVETIGRAMQSAARPGMLRFAVPHTMNGYLVDLPESVEPVFYDAAQGLNGILPWLSDETYFLSLTGPHAFMPRWDNALLSHAKRLGRRALITASISPAPAVTPARNDEVSEIKPKIDGTRLAALRRALPALQKRSAQPDQPRGILPQLRHLRTAAPAVAQAHLPALKEVQEDGSVTIGRGLALVCAAEPIHTLVIDPAFLFGRVTFLMEDEPLDTERLSLSAYLTGFSVYALHEAVLWPTKACDRSILRLPPPDTLPGTTLARFEKLLGFHTGENRPSAKAAMGLFGHEDTYPQKMPGNLLMGQRFRSARMKLFEIHMPLMVSAFVDLPNPRVASAFYLLRFGFLRRIASLPVLLYTGGSQERALRAVFPHTQSYPDSTLLPKSLLQSGMKPEEHFARSKMLLLQRAAKRQVEFTHTAWLDMDILPHPVCTDAVPDFEPLMDDRIHIATVNGIPDPSFVVVPTDLAEPLAKLVQSITQLDAELKRGFGEALLWERIFQRKPQWFAIHPMPRRRLLFLSAFDHRLLSHSLKPLITDLPKPYYASLADGSSRPQPKKEKTQNVQ